jgi:hypothetical protein
LLYADPVTIILKEVVMSSDIAIALAFFFFALVLGFLIIFLL